LSENCPLYDGVPAGWKAKDSASENCPENDEPGAAVGSVEAGAGPAAPLGFADVPVADAGAGAGLPLWNKKDSVSEICSENDWAAELAEPCNEMDSFKEN